MLLLNTLSLRWAVMFALAVAVAPLGEAIAQTADEKEQQRIARWAPQIAAYEAQDEKDPPPTGANLFVGSSSIRLWNLEESFGDLPVINRGFGGSQLADSVHYADQLIIKHRPKVVVVYAGDNDLNGGKKPATVAADFKALVERVQGDLPAAKIVFIGIKPSLARWKIVDQVREANSLIAKQCEANPLATFVDVDKPMLDEQGKPRGELFRKDGLHLSEAGYKLWASLVRPHLIDR